MVEGRAAFRKDPSRLEKWDEKNFGKFSKEESQVLPQGRKHPCCSPGWEAALQERPWWAPEHGPAMCPGRRDSQQPPGPYDQGHSQQIKGRDHPPSVLHSALTRPHLAMSNTRKTRRELSRGPPRWSGLEHVPYKGRLRDQVLLQPRKALGAPNGSQPVPTGRLTRRWRQALHGMRTRNTGIT